MSEPFSLAERAWLPVATTARTREFICIRDIARPDILRIDTGRPDCDISVTEFLIGLLAISALAPRNKPDWGPRFRNPPSPDEIDQAIAPFALALVLDGPGPRFFQDFEPLNGDALNLDDLLIEKGAEYFSKSGRIRTVSRAAASILLLTLQTSAPEGGRGHFTSLRGGGPITTLIIPRVSERHPSLWQLLWANIPNGFGCESACVDQVFPWLRATRISGTAGCETTPEHVHKAQAFFGMPRRIRLNFFQNTGHVCCDLFGCVDDVVIGNYVTRPYGANYTNWSKSHPLSPYRKPKENETEYLPLHLRSSSVAYGQWIGLALKETQNLNVPAESVSLFLRERRRDAGISVENSYKAGVLVCGYAMKSAKPLDFTEAYLPIIVTETLNGDRDLAFVAKTCIEAADICARLLSGSLKRALFGNNPNLDSDNTALNAAKARFWTGTEEPFYGLLRDAAKAADEAGIATESKLSIYSRWLPVLRRHCERIFDDVAPIDAPESPNIQQVVAARTSLILGLNGFGKDGSKLFETLCIPMPVQKKNGKKK